MSKHRPRWKTQGERRIHSNRCGVIGLATERQLRHAVRENTGRHISRNSSRGMTIDELREMISANPYILSRWARNTEWGSSPTATSDEREFQYLSQDIIGGGTKTVLIR